MLTSERQQRNDVISATMYVRNWQSGMLQASVFTNIQMNTKTDKSKKIVKEYIICIVDIHPLFNVI